MITKLQAQNIKGQSFTHLLSPVTVFVGPNRKGKTARLRAAQLALWGHIPALGKRPSATFTMASGDTMGVDAEIIHKDKKSSISRTWKKRSTGAKLDSTGQEPQVLDILLDPEQFLSLSSNDRMKYIFDQALAKYSLEQPAVVARLKKLTSDEWEEIHQQALNQVIISIPDMSDDPGKWISELIETMEERRKIANSSTARLKSSLEASATTVSAPMNVGELEAQKDQFSKQATATAASIEKLQRDIVDAEKKAQEKLELTNQLVSLYVSPEGMAAANEAIDKLEEEVKTEPPSSSSLLEEQEEVVAELDKLEKHRQFNIDAAKRAEELIELERDKEEKTEYIKAARIWVEEHAKKLKEFGDVASSLKEKANSASGSCDKCGTDLVEIAQRELKHATSEFLSLDKEIKKRTDEGVAIKESLAKTEAKIAELEKAGINPIEIDEDKINDLRAKQLELASDIKNAESVRDAHQAKLRELDRAKQAQRDLVDRKDRHAKLEKQVNDIVIPEVSDLKATIAQLTEDVQRQAAEAEEAEAKWKQAVQYATNKNQTEKNKQLMEEAAAEYLVLRKVVDELRAIRAEMVEKAIQPVLDDANLLATAVMMPLKFRDGEIGYTRENGQWVPFKTFSGTETDITQVAISYALAAKSPMKIVILDELGRLDDDNKKRLMTAVLSLTKSKKLDQFICADVRREPYDNINGVSVIEA